jgi:hypothetical protein
MVRGRVLSGALLLAVCTFGCIGLGCIGTTGGKLVTFEAVAGAPDSAPLEGDWRFSTTVGFDVTLRRAQLQVGSVYLHQTRPALAGRETSCILPGIYVAEATSGQTVNLLSSRLSPFPAGARGTTDRALGAEVWLGTGPIDAPEMPDPVLEAEGTAVDMRAGAGASYPFRVRFTIGSNREIPPKDPALPGSNPLCQQRVVSPIAVDVTVRATGRWVVRPDVRRMFDRVDFSGLATREGDTFIFSDEGADPPSVVLYNDMRRIDAYDVRWED